MGYMFPWLHDPVSTHGGENVVLWVQRTAVMLRFKIPDPKGQPAEGITRRQLGLSKYLVVVALPLRLVSSWSDLTAGCSLRRSVSMTPLSSLLCQPLRFERKRSMYGSPYRFVSDSNLRSFLFSFINSKFLSQPQYQFCQDHTEIARKHHLDHTVHAVDAKALNSRCFVTRDRSAIDMLDARPLSPIIRSAVSVETLPSDHLNIRSMYSLDIASE
jgi:hypothetical protein